MCDGRLDGHEFRFLRIPRVRKPKVKQQGTHLVLQRLLSLFDLFLRFRYRTSGFGLVSARIVQRTVPRLFLFAQLSERLCKRCDFLCILFEILLYSEQFEEQPVENQTILRI